MYLKELTINGFKSFAKKGELEFSTPITAIVGPNGSGKSNVAEAFRFVLGEQSIKSMRGKKGEDLIFNGSEDAARANRAAVAITISNEERNGKRVFPIDFDELVVERTVHRDGVNEYSLNGSRTRLKDVQELLASANIGPTGHHIISQGEADRILSASPKERREMIEDALGLKIFQYKKAESQRKLKKTLENVAQVESLRREVKPHLTFLERQIKKIEKSLELQKTLTSFYAEYLRREDGYIAYHTDRLKNERQKPQRRREELEGLLATAKEKLVKTKDNQKGEKLVSLEENISKLRNKRHDVVRTTGQLEGQITFLERRIDEAQKKNEEANGAAIPYASYSAATGKIEDIITSAENNEDISFLHSAFRDIRDVVRSLLNEAKQTDIHERLEGEMRELAELKEEKKRYDRELEAIANEEETLAQSYEDLKQSIEEESSESREAEREIFEIMNEQRELDQKLSSINQELLTLERDRNEFKRELEEAVSLVGRGASSYFSHVVVDESGNEIPREEFVREDRTQQYERRRELEKMKIRLEELGTGSNEDVVKEYKDVKERDEFLEREIVDLHASVQKLEVLIEDLTNQLNEQFIVGIEKIGTEFEHFFVLMFGGGAAKLVRVAPKAKRRKDSDEDLASISKDEGIMDEEDEGSEETSEEGIEIDIKLPNKRVRGLDMLSGGERALTSIALIFAMSQVNPPLFIVLDETDAALDEANSRRYGDMIEALAKRSQLILITHNRETMGRAGVLYGVTMGGDGISKLLSVKFDEAVAVAK